MKILEQRPQLNHYTYKIVNIGYLNNTSGLSKTPPKLELTKNAKKYTETDEKEYAIISKTQEIVVKQIFTPNMTVQQLCGELKNIINSEQINIHEVYTVVSMYSLWECLQFLMSICPIDKIANNGHKFNVLHKALLPPWLWNYHNHIKVLPKNMTRNINDMLITTKYLLDNNLAPSVLEPTPRTQKNTDEQETAIAILTRTLPYNLVASIHNELYSALTCNLTEHRISCEMDYILSQISSTKMQFDNALKWLIIQSPSKVADILIKKYKADGLTEQLKLVVHHAISNVRCDRVFDKYFAKYLWHDERVATFTKELIISSKKQLNNELHNVVCDALKQH